MDPEHAREWITEERARVQGLIDEVRTELGQSDEAAAAELSDYDQHPADSGSETFEREKDFSILEELEAELAELEAAHATDRRRHVRRRRGDRRGDRSRATRRGARGTDERRHRPAGSPFGHGAGRLFGHGA